MSITLEDENGEVLDQLDDPTDLLRKLLPEPDDEQFLCLTDLDWYGETVFERSRAKRLLAEVYAIAGRATDVQSQSLLTELERLVDRWASSAGQLRFRGE